jgi:hypothetical protein
MPLSPGTLRWREASVKYQGIEVGAVGPGDSGQLVIDVYLGEEVGIGQPLEYRAMQCPGDATRVTLRRLVPSRSRLLIVE